MIWYEMMEYLRDIVVESICRHMAVESAYFSISTDGVSGMMEYLRDIVVESICRHMAVESAYVSISADGISGR